MKLCREEIEKINKLSKRKFRIKGDVISWINDQARIIISYYTYKAIGFEGINENHQDLNTNLENMIRSENSDPIINRINTIIIQNIIKSSLNEKKSFLKSLQGKRISSGPSGAPTRGKIEVLPTGKNFYSVDLRCIPTQAAWDLGKRSSDEILNLYLLENGCDLSHLAMSVWGTSTMRNGGEDICQLLSMIGIMPVWDTNTNKLIDLD